VLAFLTYGSTLVIARKYANNATRKLYFKYVNLTANFKFPRLRRNEIKQKKIIAIRKNVIYVSMKALFTDFNDTFLTN